jgi:predicted PurR-regulated permease PerM
VVADGPSALTDFLKAAPSVLISVFASVFLTFLLLLHGEHLLRKFVFLMPAWGDKRTFVVVTRAAQLELSRYLFTISVINFGLGLATAAALALLGVPDPLLWAGVVALLNYAPYLGPAISALLLLIAGFADHTSLVQALAAPGAFLALHLLEGQLITPLLVGRQLKLDPVVIFIALLTFGWIWGIVGLLLAVPLLACLKVLVERLPGGAPWARLLVSRSGFRRA